MCLFRSLSESNTSDFIPNAIAVLEALNNVSNAITAVPFLSAVLNPILGILNTIQAVCAKREAARFLAKDGADLVDHDLDEHCAKLELALNGIFEDIQKLAESSTTSRIYRRCSLAAKPDGCIADIEDARRSFIPIN
ncbi:hypothetical protein CERSUDRAFT_72475 [Gelatoporia subvermispora B]|uniref:Uncharacterized protein n=1 Tax=Ceriporiopsis subvermispora (strain B) TaxID=914234 RepID=M2RLF6_CERS8|nr:hypothetical protein CERSUDRAFT_72475 [Gelatoporia subvermispora B]